MNTSELIEKLADAEHASWAHWMEYLFSKCVRGADGSATIPAVLVERWEKQTRTPYAVLTEQEKVSDRNEVHKIMPFIDAYIEALSQRRE